MDISSQTYMYAATERKREKLIRITDTRSWSIAEWYVCGRIKFIIIFG